MNERYLRRALTASILGAVALSLSTADAVAKIRCKGAFQVIQGSLHATPYCEDALLASVARQYGMRVSNRALRNDPFLKTEACRLAGHDNRVRSIFAGEFNSGRRRWP